MSDLAMSDVVNSWKKYVLRPTDLVFVDVVKSIGTPESKVEALRVDDDWVLVRKGTKEPAVMAFAGVFARADPYDTGNLIKRVKKDSRTVSKGNSSDDDENGDGRMQQYASFKCNYSYALDTRADREIWDLQGALDDYMTSLPEFNPQAVNRTKWQTGLYQDSSKKYWFKVPMFLRLGDDEESPDPPAKLHRWVRAADKRSDMYRANPARPEVWARTSNGTTTPIEKTVERELQQGDAVVVAFMVRYQVNRTWGPQFLLKEITRVLPRSDAVAMENVVQGGASLVVDTSERLGMVDGEFVPGPPELSNIGNRLDDMHAADGSVVTARHSTTPSGPVLASASAPSAEAMDVDKAVTDLTAVRGAADEPATDGLQGLVGGGSTDLESDESRSTADDNSSDAGNGRGKRRRVEEGAVVAVSAGGRGGRTRRR